MKTTIVRHTTPLQEGVRQNVAAVYGGPHRLDLLQQPDGTFLVRQRHTGTGDALIGLAVDYTAAIHVALSHLRRKSERALRP